MSHMIQKRIARTVGSAMLFFLFIILSLTLLCTAMLSRSYRGDLAEMSCAFARLSIDADAARNYLTLREMDGDYQAVLGKLQTYRENSSGAVKRISLVSFSNTTGSYIYDTGENKLGDRLEYDAYTDSVRDALMDGHESLNVYRNGSYFVYEPLRTVDDKLAGYLIIEMTDPFRTTYVILFGATAAVLVAVAAAIAFFIMRRMRRRVFQPIARFTEAAVSFTGSSEEADLTELFTDREDEIGQLGMAIQKMFVDISSGAESLNQAVHKANHDGMTQTLNKGCYLSMEEKFRRCGSICVVYFDVNNLKLMNDTLGHEQGDYVIKQAAAYIRSLLSPADYCFRMGGDEFLVVMTECSFRAIDALAEKLDADAPHILNPEEETVRCALSYGYAYAKGDYSYEALLAEAEENMYAKKAELKTLMQMPDR